MYHSMGHMQAATFTHREAFVLERAGLSNGPAMSVGQGCLWPLAAGALDRVIMAGIEDTADQMCF
jgi:hypothetical protein